MTEDAFQALALTNYGHFTTMRVEDGRVRGLDLHLDRLARDCAALFGARLDPDLVRTRLRAAISGDTPATVRVTVCDPAFSLASPAAAMTPRVIVTTRAPVPDRLPPLRVRSIAYTRDVPEVKHTGLFGPLHQRRLAQQAGYDDAVFVDADRRLSEGVTWNLGFVVGDTVVWPAAAVLPGVTQALLSTAYSGPVRTEPVTVDRLGSMAAAFATNAAGGIRAISAIDGVEWAAGHAALERLRIAYEAVEPEPI